MKLTSHDVQSIESQMNTMVIMQDQLNRKIHPLWTEQNYPWLRAVWIECGEAMDHLTWKWWKGTVPNLDQLKLEVIDIWHFLLSDQMQNASMDTIVKEAILGYNTAISQPKTIPLTDAIENLVFSLPTRQQTLARFFLIVHQLKMSFDDLFRAYIGKNVLNTFRQDHGYNQGTYRKIWDGREDNEHLTEIMAGLDSSAPDFLEKLNYQLKTRYITTS